MAPSRRGTPRASPRTGCGRTADRSCPRFWRRWAARRPRRHRPAREHCTWCWLAPELRPADAHCAGGGGRARVGLLRAGVRLASGCS
eukprot:4225036-Lingulodinium_polyedra.AAC.1